MADTLAAMMKAADREGVARLLKMYPCLARYPHGVDRPTATSLAAATGDPDTLRVVLRAGGRLMESDNLTGWTPLHHAAAAGSVRCVKLLMVVGAVRTTNRAGEFPHEVTGDEACRRLLRGGGEAEEGLPPLPVKG